MKIAVIGMGGIGGLVGGALAKNYPDIYFIARGENLKAISENGVLVKSDKLGDFSAKPALVTDNATEIGEVDVLIIATKSYGLAGACESCQSLVGENTVVIPLLNGVFVSEDAKKYFSRGQMADGCIYCFSSLESPGTVRHIGDLLKIEFGFADGRDNAVCQTLAHMLNQSGIVTSFTQTILVPVWGKYIMMCGNSCVFSVFQCNAGEVHRSPEKMAFIENVYTELYNLARSKNVPLPQTLVAEHMETFKRLPDDAITSLYRDLLDTNKKTEFEAIIGKGYHLAKEAGLDTPCLDTAYNKNRGR